MSTGYLGLPVHGGTPREVATVVNRLNQGKMNVTGSVTLAENADDTTLSDPRIGPDSVIVFMPTTASAAAELGTLYVTDQGAGTAKINHSNAATDDRTYRYAVLG